MDMLDVFAVFGLERFSDRTEERYGRTVAWWLALAMCLSAIAALVAVLFILI
jgi:hypothetical protein